MDLPPEVIAQIQAKRKIEAIKLLREARGISLKDAKEAVDAYIRRERLESRKNPKSRNSRETVPRADTLSRTEQASRPETASRASKREGQHRLFLLALAIVVGYVAYRVLA